MPAPGYRELMPSRRGKKFGEDTRKPSEPRYGLDGGDGTFGEDVRGPGRRPYGQDSRRPGGPKTGEDTKRPGQGRTGLDSWGQGIGRRAR